jgi:hypothetical protein
MIHADLGCYRLLGVARPLDISLQCAQHLVRANYIFFWQLIPPLPACRPEIYFVGDVQMLVSLSRPTREARLYTDSREVLPEAALRPGQGHFGSGTDCGEPEPEVDLWQIGHATSLTIGERAGAPEEVFHLFPKPRFVRFRYHRSVPR